MHVQINVNTAEPLSDQDKTVLLALAGFDAESAYTHNEVVEVAVQEVREAVEGALRGKPAPKANPAKPVETSPADEEVEEVKAPPKPKAAPPKPAPKAAPAEDDGPTLEDAITLATELVSKGRQPEIKAALEGIGVKRVSELKGKQIAEFIQALEA